MHIFSITLFIMGSYLISNSIIRTNFFEDGFYFNPYIEELKEFEFSYQNNFTNYNDNHLPSLAYLSSLPILPTEKSTTNYLSSLPEDFYSIKDAKIKKEKFINLLLPLIMAENNKILSFRYQIKKIQNLLNLNKTLNKRDQMFIEKLAFEYSVKVKNRHKVDIINDLLDHIDVIPNSIVLAQAANESGWGSSRFARDFNALFGQYTYDSNNGVKPFARDEGAKHLIKFFPTINQSIESYFNNINTHIAYYDFRKARKHLREKDLFLDPKLLIKTLDNYAEDKHYVDTIISIIKINKLTQYDNLKTI